MSLILIVGLFVYDARKTRARREAFAAAAAERGLTYTQGEAMGELHRTTTHQLIRLFRLAGTTSGVTWTLEVTRAYRYVTQQRNGRRTSRREYDPVFMHWVTLEGRLTDGGALFLPDAKATLQTQVEGRTGFITRLSTGLMNMGIDAYESGFVRELGAGAWTVQPLVDPSLEQGYVAYASDGEALAYVLTREMTTLMEARKPKLTVGITRHPLADTSPDVSMPIFMVSTDGTEVVWNAPAYGTASTGYDMEAIFKIVNLGVQLAKMPRGF